VVLSAAIHSGGRGYGRDWRWDCVSGAEVAQADGRVGAVCNCERGCVGGEQPDRRRAVGVLGVPEDGSRAGQLVGDA